MKRIFAMLLVITILCYGSVAYGDGIFPTTAEIYGEYMPSVAMATGKIPAVTHTDDGEIVEVYSDFAYADYEKLGAYLDAEECIVSEASSDGRKVTIDILCRSKIFTITYSGEDHQLTVYYPKGTRNEKSVYALAENENSGKNILPYYEEVFGYYLPTVSAAIKRTAYEVNKNSDGSTEYKYKQFTDDEYNIFSTYLDEKGCTVVNYAMDGKKMTIELERKGSAFTFVYDRDSKEATVIYPVSAVLEKQNNCNVIGHEWQAATCTEPKTCSHCGATEGKALGHSLGNWTETKKPTEITDGEKTATCTRCGDIISEAIRFEVTSISAEYSGSTEAGIEVGKIKNDITVTAYYSDHSSKIVSEWTTAYNPILEVGKTKVVTIRYEGKECTISVMCTTSLQGFKEECKNVYASHIMHDRATYEGKNVRISGKIMQVVNEARSSMGLNKYLVTDAENGIVYVTIISTDVKDTLIEDDRVAVYGTCTGTYSYTTVLGISKTVPKIDAVAIEQR